MEVILVKQGEEWEGEAGEKTERIASDSPQSPPQLFGSVTSDPGWKNEARDTRTQNTRTQEKGSIKLQSDSTESVV